MNDTINNSTISNGTNNNNNIYTVGDKVVLKRNLVYGNTYGCVDMLYSMSTDRVLTITHIEKVAWKGKTYKVYKLNNKYWYDKSMFMPYRY